VSEATDASAMRWRTRTRALRYVLAFLATAAVVIGLVVWFAQRALIYLPDPMDPGSASGVFESGSDVVLNTDDGLSLAAWRVDPVESNGMAVLYLPGNAGNRLNRVDVGQALADEGFVVLLIDYRGYGGNPGTPTEDGLELDAEAAVSYLDSIGFSSSDTIYVGESLGTGVATRLASIVPPAGLVLRSPYSSMAAVAESAIGLPIGWMVRDRFDTLDAMRSVACPVTVLAGADDTLVPLDQSRAVAESAPNLFELVVVAGAGHNDRIWFGDFLATHVKALADATTG